MLLNLLRSLLVTQPAPVLASTTGYVAFIVEVGKPSLVTPETSAQAPLAAFRLRTWIAARRVAQTEPAWLVPPESVVAPGGLGALGTARTVFIGKFITGTILAKRAVFAGLMQWLRDAPRDLAIVADITDDFDSLPMKDAEAQRFLSAWQAALLRRCHITVTCNALRDMLAARAERGITVVEDPYEADGVSPWRMPGADPVRICWFGNTSAATLPALAQALQSIVTRFPDTRFSVELVTTMRGNMIRDLAQQLVAARRGVEFTMTEWSLDSTWRALERCDFVLLPHAWRDDWVKVKSHNRLVAAIAAGRMALGSPIPSYLELKDYAWVDDDLAGGIAWTLANPDAARERVERGQAYVVRHHSPAAVAEKWAHVLGGTLPGRARAEGGL